MNNYLISVELGAETYLYNIIDGTYKISSEKNNEYNELESYNSLLTKTVQLSKQEDFFCITVAITKACNFRCTYCFEEHNDCKLEISSLAGIADIICEYYKLHNFKKLVVIWFGGEPTLYVDYIKEATDLFTKLSKEYCFMYSSRIITNGYSLELITPYLDDFYITDIQITLDGSRKIHDSRRKTIGGKGTFDKIISNIKKINKYVDLVLRVNVDANNIDNVYELYKYFAQSINNPFIEIYFQPMLVENYGGESTCYLGKVAQDILLYEKYVNVLALTHSLEKPSYIKAFCNESFIGSLVISSDKKLYKCWADIEGGSSLIGEIGIDSSQSIASKLNQYKFSSKYARCKECDYFPACLSGCQFLNYSFNDCQRIKDMILYKIKYCIKNNL